MDFTALPVAALPLPAAAPSPHPSVPPTLNLSVPLAQRFPLNATISAKIDYYDLAHTRRAPFDLRTAAIFLCLCAHDNGAWFVPRTPDHADGEDEPPLPPILNFASWLRYIREWQNANLAFDEEEQIVSLAIRVWLGAHETAVFPEESGQKKTPPAADPTGPNSTPTSSPEAMPAGATTCSTVCPSAPSTPSSTHGSAPTGSPPSAHQSATAETAK